MMRFGPSRVTLGHAPAGASICGRSMEKSGKPKTPLQLLAQFQPVEHQSTDGMKERLATIIPLRHNLMAILEHCSVPLLAPGEVLDTLAELKTEAMAAGSALAPVLCPMPLADFNNAMVQIDAECGKVKATLSYYYWLVDRSLYNRKELETAF